MTVWTESARRDFDAWSHNLREKVAGTGADVDEVVADLRAHVAAEVAKRGLQVVNSDDLHQILREIGEPDIVKDTRTASAPAPRPGTVSSSAKGRISLLFFGVVLPIITLGIELATHMCAGAFFDPIPTWWHVLVVACVPAINFLLWRRAFQAGETSVRLLNWLTGLALGFGAVYTLLFLPLMIPGFIAVIFLGWGLLPLSPFLAFIATLRLRSRLRKAPDAGLGSFSRSGLAGGLAIGIAMLLLPEVPSASTRLAMQWADSENPAVERRGIAFLRTFGHEHTMLQICYDRMRRFLDPAALVASPGDRLTQQEARDIYFRVTGRAFNSVPPPMIYTRAGRWDMMEDEFTWEFDEGLGGEAVAGRVRGLSLISSRIDGVVESSSGVGYHEWIMEFRNDARVQREARAQIALPPGGVVSRLTLWINGEEREAAFGGRSQVREAYQKVAVQQRRDPVLVTTAGPDRVLMQCFPVPPNGGTMKVRVGITAPLQLLDEEQARLAWPHFLERNFNLTPGLKHSIWMESRARLVTASEHLRPAHREDDRTGLQGELQPDELNDPLNHLQVTRAAPVAEQVWTPAMDGGHIAQQLVQNTNDVPDRMVVVLDGSAEIEDHLAAIAEAVATLEGRGELRVLLATDSAHDGWSELLAGTTRAARSHREVIARLKPVGGQDNVAALRHAWDLAAESANGVVVWIHGPQPVLLESAEGLRQRLERSGGRTRIVDFQTRIGPNRVAEQLDGFGVRSVMRTDSVAADLKELFAGLSTAGTRPAFERRHFATAAPADGAKEVSKHIARLWAANEVHRLTRHRALADAVKLAGDYQLITPVSGAVVLETQAQYDLAGLTPVDAATVPVVPEPSTWALLILGLLILQWIRRHRVRRHTAA